jgi:DNA-3-methyladenine glycosylase II
MVKRLAVAAPFNLEATVRVLQRRPSNLIDGWENQRYRRTIRLGGQLLLIEVANRGTIDSPDLWLSILPRDIPSSARTKAARITSDILGLTVDSTQCQRRAESAATLRWTALALRGLRPPRYPDFFETFANVIPFQQLSLEAGMAVTRKLVQRFGDALLLNGRRYPAFPSAEVIADTRTASLKSCGLSAKKSLALRSIAQAIASGTLSAREMERLPSSAALERLLQLPGIGPWSAALVLLRGFGRLDVFPQADAGVESSLIALMRLPSRASLARVAGRFGECRGYLYYYGLASRLLSAQLIHPAPTALPPSSNLHS